MPITYDKKAKRYRDSRGRFISQKVIKRDIERLQLRMRKDSRNLSRKFNDGKISLAKWKSEMKALIKSNHLVSSSVGRGGWKQMSQKDWGKLGSAIKKEYRYLERFAGQIEKGKLSPKQIINRSGLYSAQLNTTYSETLMDEQGKDKQEAKRTLNAMESCPECVSYAGRWMPIDEMPPISSLICGSMCKCSLTFR